MVRDGKISRGALERVRRMENAHANSVEGYAVFVAGVVRFLSLSFDFSLLLLRLVDFPCDEFCEKMLTDLLS